MTDEVLPRRIKGDSFRIGLCSNCLQMRQIESDRGSTFYLCQLSTVDPSFPKYPRLPVLKCAGYEPKQGTHNGGLSVR